MPAFEALKQWDPLLHNKIGNLQTSEIRQSLLHMAPFLLPSQVPVCISNRPVEAEVSVAALSHSVQAALQLRVFKLPAVHLTGHLDILKLGRKFGYVVL